MYCIGTIEQLKYGFSGYMQYPFPLPVFISLGCASGSKPSLGVMETASIPHNHTLTVYYRSLVFKRKDLLLVD